MERMSFHPVKRQMIEYSIKIYRWWSEVIANGTSASQVRRFYVTELCCGCRVGSTIGVIVYEQLSLRQRSPSTQGDNNVSLMNVMSMSWEIKFMERVMDWTEVKREVWIVSVPPCTMEFLKNTWYVLYDGWEELYACTKEMEQCSVLLNVHYVSFVIDYMGLCSENKSSTDCNVWESASLYITRLSQRFLRNYYEGMRSLN